MGKDTWIAIAKRIDAVSNWVGKIFSYLVLPLTALIVFEVITRRFFNAPTIWTFELSNFLFGSHFMLVAAYGLLYKSHVSIDLVSMRFSKRTQEKLQLFCYFTMFFLGTHNLVPWHHLCCRCLGHEGNVLECLGSTPFPHQDGHSCDSRAVAHARNFRRDQEDPVFEDWRGAMSPELIAILMFVVLVIFLFMGHPLAFVLAGVGILFGLFGLGFNTFGMFMNRIYGTMDNFVLVAITLFILMGNFLTMSGVAEELFKKLRVLLGPVAGGSDWPSSSSASSLRRVRESSARRWSPWGFWPGHCSSSMATRKR